jgi:hypothetical protein
MPPGDGMLSRIFDVLMIALFIAAFLALGAAIKSKLAARRRFEALLNRLRGRS